MSDIDPEDFEDPETLAGQLRSIGPDSRIMITWETPNGLVSAEGTVTDFERGRAYKRIDTDDRTLQITTDEYNTRVTVSEVTPDGTTDLGPLRAIPVIERAVEELRITDEGVEVPSYYVGYDGLMTIRDSDGPATANMIGGLGEYDDRLLTGFTTLPPHYDEEEVLIGPLGGPTRVFEIVDERMWPDLSDDEKRLEETPYQAFVPATALVRELLVIISEDYPLDIEDRVWGSNTVSDIAGAIKRTRKTVLPLDSTLLFDRYVRNTDARTWETYGEVFSTLETLLTDLDDLVRDDESLSGEERAAARTELRAALNELEELRERVPADHCPAAFRETPDGEGPEDDDTDPADILFEAVDGI